MATKQSTREEVFHVRGDELKQKIKDIIKEGNARRIIIKNKSGKTLMEFPVTVGVIGVVLAPVWIAIGAIAAVVAECSITVEKQT
ncbi:MAG: DUF4342 domain-containing protein [Patescibacteria group bacterium]|nr:DUF4342 domain-containing protein [Patescibacteria group bacterium]MDE2588998.1 DUF4342 domain-containing protein [Patescibacteria group bacterium]